MGHRPIGQSLGLADTSRSLVIKDSNQCGFMPQDVFPTHLCLYPVAGRFTAADQVGLQAERYLDAPPDMICAIGKREGCTPLTHGLTPFIEDAYRRRQSNRGEEELQKTIPY